MTQTGTKVTTDTRNPKQYQGQRAHHGPHTRSDDLIYADIGADFPWRLMRKEKPLKFISLVLFPCISSGPSASLIPKSMEESFSLLSSSREITLLPLKSNFSCLLRALFWVSTHWNAKSELFWLDTDVPQGCPVFWWSAIIEGKNQSWCKHSQLWMQNSSSVEIPWLLETCSSHRLHCQ